MPSQPLPSGATLDPLVLTLTNQFYGGMEALTVGTAGTSGYVSNMQIAGETNLDGRGLTGFAMAQRLATGHSRYNTTGRGAPYEDRQTITFAFDRVVTDLKFTITDIDSYKAVAGSTNNQRWSYWDSVYLDVTPSAEAHGIRVAGSGTVADPWTSTMEPTLDDDTNRSSLPNNAAGGAVDVTLQGPIRNFSLTFWNKEARRISSTTRGQQAIFLTDFAFTASTCRPTSK